MNATYQMGKAMAKPMQSNRVMAASNEVIELARF